MAQVQEGLGADDLSHTPQLHIILDRTDALLDDFAPRLQIIIEAYFQVLEVRHSPHPLT